MNKPTPIGKKTFAEYEKEVNDYKEFNLKSQKIELNLTGDAKSVIKEGKALQKKMISAYKPFIKLESDFEKIYNRIQDFLGETKGLTQNAEAIQKQANSIYYKIEKQAKELGVNIADIPVAKQLDEIAVDLEDNITDIENARRQAKDI